MKIRQIFPCLLDLKRTASAVAVFFICLGEILGEKTEISLFCMVLYDGKRQ